MERWDLTFATRFSSLPFQATLLSLSSPPALWHPWRPGIILILFLLMLSIGPRPAKTTRSRPRPLCNPYPQRRPLLYLQRTNPTFQVKGRWSSQRPRETFHNQCRCRRLSNRLPLLHPNPYSTLFRPSTRLLPLLPPKRSKLLPQAPAHPAAMKILGPQRLSAPSSTTRNASRSKI